MPVLINQTSFRRGLFSPLANGPLLAAAALIFITLFCAGSAAAVDPAEYKNRDLHYSLRLPLGWTAIPKMAIEQTQNEISRRTGAPVQVYVAAFQKPADKYFTYPYLMIQHRFVPHVSLDELGAQSQHIDLDSTKSAFEKAGLMKGMTVGQTVIDDTHQALISKIQIDVPQSGPINGIVALLPGTQGVVQLNFYTAVAAAAQEEALFDDLLDSFRFEAGHGYSPGGAGASVVNKSSSYLLGYIIGFLGGMLAVLAIFRLVRKKKDDDDSPVSLPS